MRLVLLLWLLCHPALGWSQWPAPCLREARCPQQQHGKAEARDSQVSQRRADTGATLVRISPTQIEQLIAAQKAENHEQEPSHDWWVIVPTLILAGATIALWLSTRDLVRGAEKTAERQLRAYVFAIAGRIEDAFSAKGGKIGVILKNSGQTPAYDCTVRYDTRLVRDTEPCPTDEPARLAQSRGDIAPGASKNMSIAMRALSPGERSALEQVGGGAILYAFGRIQYTDAFKKERRQWFCYAFGGIYGSSDSGHCPKSGTVTIPARASPTVTMSVRQVHTSHSS